MWCGWPLENIQWMILMILVLLGLQRAKLWQNGLILTVGMTMHKCELAREFERGSSCS